MNRMGEFDGLGFGPTEILLPEECDLQKWAVVACDQYTSQPEYWERVERFVGDAPSALRLILPEGCLDGPNVENDITEINTTMTRYLRSGQFRTYPDALFYVERTLASGAVRRGLIGAVDLEEYDYEAGSATLIRATEGTILSRIPPRVAVRKNAPIELPHVMLLCDDPEGTILPPLTGETETMEKLYDFDLMEGSGHLAGWLLTPEQKRRVAVALRARKGEEEHAMLFAVGDGNHSLATAKECYERQKRLTPPDKWESLPSRWALVEVCNLYDKSLEFTPIHRVVFDVDADQLLDAFLHRYPGAKRTQRLPENGQSIAFACEDEEGYLWIEEPEYPLPVATLQAFLDDYLIQHSGRVDYVHGADVARDLARRKRTIAFFLPALDKYSLFPAIQQAGALPRKTFSVGEARHKRFYLEARKIR